MPGVHLNPGVIPETRSPPPPVTRRDAPESHLEHICIPFYDLTQTGSTVGKKIAVNCEYLRITADWPVLIELDGKGLVTDNLPYSPSGTTMTGRVFAPVTDVEVRRSVQTLTLKPGSNGNYTFDEVEKNIWGQVDVWYGSAEVRALGPSQPISFGHVYDINGNAWQATVVPPFTLTLGPVNPSIHGNDQSSPNGIVYVPQRMNLVTLSGQVAWAGPIGTITRIDVLWRNRLGTFDTLLRSWRTAADAGLTIMTQSNRFPDITHPIRIPGAGSRSTTGGTVDGLLFRIHGTAQFDAGGAQEIHASYEGFM